MAYHPVPALRVDLRDTQWLCLSLYHQVTHAHVHSLHPLHNPSPYRVYVQYVHVEVVGVQLHALEDGLQGHGHAALQSHHLQRVGAKSALDKAQQVLLVHAGRGVDVGVHFPGEWKCMGIQKIWDWNFKENHLNN